MKEDAIDDVLDKERPNDFCFVCGEQNVRPYRSINAVIGPEAKRAHNYLTEPTSRHPEKVFSYDFVDFWEAAVKAGEIDADKSYHVFLCVGCFDDIIDAGRAKQVPPSACDKCKKVYDQDAHGFEGTDLDDKGEGYMGYGSTTADGDKRKFDLPKGWYCYECLDALVRDGKSTFVSAYMFLNSLRKDQPRDSVDTYKQALYQARMDIALTVRQVEYVMKTMKANGKEIRVFDKQDDPIVESFTPLVLMRHRFHATARVITEILGDNDKWQDGGKDGENIH
jgi:hypothetical protein